MALQANSPRHAPLTLADRLAAAHQRRFVGRLEEKELFKAAISGSKVDFILLHIYGPGGVGKTTLLKEFSNLAKDHEVTPIQLDARNIDPSPEGFFFALRLALGLSEISSPLEAINQLLNKIVLTIDTYETLTPLDGWLRESFLPKLPKHVLIVFAGRKPPSSSWLSDPDWCDLVRSISLRNLRPEESRTLLDKRGVPKAKHQEVLDFTHGHPLALSLVADVLENQKESQDTFELGSDPDIVRALLERFIQQAPSPTHQLALETCALVRVTTEDLLTKVLALDDVHEFFEWLRSLSFIESNPVGIFPHDLVREVLDADLRWRNPDRYAELHGRVRGYYNDKLMTISGMEQQRILFDDVYLHRHNPMVKPFFEWSKYGSLFGKPATKEDHNELLAMIEKHEGIESAKLAAQWFEKQPEGLTVYYGTGQKPAGLLFALRLDKANSTDLEADPATHAASNFIRSYAPARASEEIIMFRFWMDIESYQDVSPTQSVIFLNIVQSYLSHSKLAWSLLPCANREFWLPVLHYADINYIPEISFEVGDKLYSIFAHDWRAVPVPAWLELLGKRELATDLKPEELEKERPVPLVVLSEPEFKEAVRDALKNFKILKKLTTNILLQSRLIAERSEAKPTAALLQALIKETAESLRVTPKNEKYYRAVFHTYLEPAASQEIAAELLELPFSTYRRHLSRGVEQIAIGLWQRELSG